jgi:gamma-glutamylputrescine oxidase
LETDVTADVCVIGGGYAGLSTALHLSQQGFRVVVLEAHRIGWGASGRNGGQLSYGPRRNILWCEKNFGISATKEIWHITTEANTLVREIIQNSPIPCNLSNGVLQINHKKFINHSSRQNVEILAKRYGHDAIHFLDTHELQDYVQETKCHGGILDKKKGVVNPMALAFGLGALVDQNGAIIYESSPVIEIKTQKRSRFQCITPHGQVTSDWIAICCNGYHDNLYKRNPYTVPLNSFMIATEQLSDEQIEKTVRQEVGIHDTRIRPSYFHKTKDNRIIFGGYEQFREKFPVYASDKTYQRMVRLFPSLNGSKIDYAWGGTFAISWTRMPIFEQMQPGILTMGGWSGEGVHMAIMGGKIAAQMLAGNAEKFDIMEKIPKKVFSPNPFLQRIAALFTSLRELLE